MQLYSFLNNLINTLYFYKSRIVWFGLGQVLCYVAFPNQFFHCGLLVFVCFIPLYMLLIDADYWSRFKIAWGFFQVFFITLFWMNPFMYYERYESVDMIVIYALFYMLFPFLFALLFALVNVYYPLRTVMVFPLAWVGFEWCMTVVPFGFPFSLAIALYEWPFFIQLAHFGGIFLVSYVVLLISLSVLFFCLCDSHLSRGVMVVLCGCCFGSFFWSYECHVNRLPAPQLDSELSIRLICVQPNISWRTAYYSFENNEFFKQINTHLVTLANQAAAVVADGVFVFPELTISDFNSQNRLLQQTFDAITRGEYGLIIGARAGDHNTILGINAEGQIQSRYQKQRLVPVFEQAEPKSKGLSGVLHVDNTGYKLGFTLCYELLFPDLFKSLVAKDADIIGAISFNTWLGNNNWPLLHAAYLPLRAVENGKPAVFVNNNGPSMVCDRFGRIINRLPVGQEGVMVVEVDNG